MSVSFRRDAGHHSSSRSRHRCPRADRTTGRPGRRTTTPRDRRAIDEGEHRGRRLRTYYARRCTRHVTTCIPAPPGPCPSIARCVPRLEGPGARRRGVRRCFSSCGYTVYNQHPDRVTVFVQIANVVNHILATMRIKKRQSFKKRHIMPSWQRACRSATSHARYSSTMEHRSLTHLAVPTSTGFNGRGGSRPPSPHTPIR
jgi:hypothetical protein